MLDVYKIQAFLQIKNISQGAQEANSAILNESLT